MTAEAERALVSAILNDPERHWDCQLKLTDFADADLGAIWGTVGQMLRAGATVDVTTIAAKGFPLHELAQIATDIGAPSNAAAYADIVRTSSHRRQLLGKSSTFQAKLKDPASNVPSLTAEFRLELDSIDGTGSRGQSAPDGIAEAHQELAQLASLQAEFGCPGIPTGVTGIRQKMGGWVPNNFYVIAAPPGVGKSSFAFHCASHAAQCGVPVGYFSLEMTAGEIWQREAARVLGIDTRQLIQCYERAFSDKRVQALQNLPITIDANTRDEAGIISGMAAMARKGARVVFIDPLMQIIPSTGDGRVDELGKTTASLRHAAKRLGIAVVLLHHLSRAHKHENRPPANHDLRGSGEIEGNATHILFLHWTNEGQKGATVREVELIVGKNRHGPVGKFDKPMQYDPRTQDWR